MLLLLKWKQWYVDAATRSKKTMVSQYGVSVLSATATAERRHYIKRVAMYRHKLAWEQTRPKKKRAVVGPHVEVCPDVSGESRFDSSGSRAEECPDILGGSYSNTIAKQVGSLEMSRMKCVYAR